jgi:hypothetical protein
MVHFTIILPYFSSSSSSSYVHTAHHHFTTFFLPWIPFWTKQIEPSPLQIASQSPKMSRGLQFSEATPTHT